MLRQPLNQGELLKLNNRTYTINTVLGDGANCIVYSAYYTDNMGLSHCVSIKECYPYNEKITRIGQSLFWESVERKTHSFDAFRLAYEKLMQWQNNFTSHAFDIFEANETLYIVMDATEGVTFDKDSSTNILDILKTVKLLAFAVGNYHKNGYLHLDIKANNFLVFPRPSEHIILFDLDTVVSIKDINAGKVKCVSYSDSCAAPEQKQGKIKKLCPATDIFAIGTVMFQKIMGRPVEPFDISPLSCRKFDEEKFDKYNPKIKRLLSNIFEKTLSANINQRYQAVEQLISDLDEAIITVSAGTPYIISDCPYASANFVGRTKELNAISDAFKSGIHTVFLHGFGGIGKSELAKKYAEIRHSEYDTVLFLSYENSLSALIESVDIQNCEERSTKAFNKVLDNSRVLLIVDNFDIDIGDDDYFDSFLRLNADIIFTTRTDFSELAIGKSKQINIENLNKNELVTLFQRESGLSIDEAEQKVIDDILHRFDYYTLIVPILAKQLKASGWTLNELNEKTKQGLKSFEDTERIILNNRKKTGLDFMRATFRIAGLSEIQKQVLINLYFLRFVKTNKEEYRKYFREANKNLTEHINTINDLLVLGWLKKKYEWQNVSDADIDIHPIIVEMIEIELNPDITKSDMLVTYINHYLPWNDLSQELIEGVDDWGVLYTDEISHKLKWFCLFATGLDLSVVGNLDYVTDTLYRLLNGNIFIVELIDYWSLSKLLTKIKDVTDGNSAISNSTLFKIANIIEISLVKESLYFGGKISVEERTAAAEKQFWITKKYADKETSSSKNDFIKHLCKPYLLLISQYRNEVSDEIFNALNEYDSILEESFENYNEIDWKDNDPILQKQVFNPSDNNGIPKETELVLDKDNTEEEYYVNKYKLGYDVVEISNELIEDTRFDYDTKSCIFSDILDCVAREIESCHLLVNNNDVSHSKQKEFLDSVDWHRFKKMSELFIDYATKNRNECDAAECERYIAIADSMLGNDSPLKQIIASVADYTVRQIEHIDEDDASEWKCITQFSDISDFGKGGGISGVIRFLYGIGHYANIARNLRKNSLMLPALIKCADTLENKIAESEKSIKSLISSWYSDPEFDLKYDVNSSEEPMSLMYNWYRTIAEFAIDAYLDVYCNNSKGSKYFELFTEYLNKMKSFTDNRYAFINHNNSNREINFAHYYCQYESISSICREYYRQLFVDEIDVENYFSIMKNDNRLSTIDILDVVELVSYDIFFEIDRLWTQSSAHVIQYINSFDWTRLEKLLDIQEDYYYSFDEGTDNFDNEAYETNLRCSMYRALVYLILDNKEQYNEYMNQLYEDFEITFKNEIKHFHWSHFTDFDDIGRMVHSWDITNTIAKIGNIMKHEFALPYLIKVSEHIHDWLKNLPDYSETMMYSWYKTIAEYAAETSDIDTYFKYQDKVDEMSGKDYEENYNLTDN